MGVPEADFNCWGVGGGSHPPNHNPPLYKPPILVQLVSEVAPLSQTSSNPRCMMFLYFYSFYAILNTLSFVLGPPNTLFSMLNPLLCPLQPTVFLSASRFPDLWISEMEGMTLFSGISSHPCKKTTSLDFFNMDQVFFVRVGKISVTVRF